MNTTFSVIMPVFNSEPYLKEALDSIIRQTLSFKDHIELILINDGSEDDSEALCLQYKQNYPENIKYKRIENSGPAVARNTGLDLVSPSSHYITFLDADDKLEANALEAASAFFSVHPSVKIAAIPIYYFEEKTGSHNLNYRFDQGSRVIDINKEYSSPHFYIGGIFIDRSIITEKVRFNESLYFWEDALFVNKIILSEQQYGVISGTKYWYRQRISLNSLVDTAWKNKYRYTELLQTGYMELVTASLQMHGLILPYVQFLLVYHLKLLLVKKNNEMMEKTLNETEIRIFVEELKKLLVFIEDKYILEQSLLNYRKEFLLNLKHDGKFGKLEFIDKIDKEASIHITEKKLKGLHVEMKGYFTSEFYSMKESDKVYIQIGNRKMYASHRDPGKKVIIWGYLVTDYKNDGFLIQVPIWCLSFRFGLETHQGDIELKRINYIKTLYRRLFKRK
ncbi:glycosyltransferase family A protein [Heyndrickxia acidicola]|uniref:Glycosyltransferase family 2 protein n=1 Tax=Heyndrickxia acidicola TaxID=209389 RepID=A0ABU6MMF8_9BACI|nr:glycosyltransferase family 2 protein [Heyndrickxia acidicola]MED1205484.1 glycosyltransferase family 2 protein [Heyndrickxia acidicola]